MLLVDSACYRRRTDTPRTATEQFLVSYAAVDAIDDMDLSPLKGRTVFVDPRYFESLDKPFVLGQLRARLLAAGANMVEKRDQANTVVEVRSAGVGVDRKDILVGIPQMSFPVGAATAAGGVPYDGLGGGFDLPELPLLKRGRQDGVAGVALDAYDAKSGGRPHSVPTTLGHSRRSDWVVLFVMFHTKDNFPY